MSLRSLLSIFALASVALACKPADDEGPPPPTPITADDAPDALARQICAGLYACDCWQAEEFGPDEAGCVATVRAELQGQLDQGLALGWSWDETCAGELVAAWEAWGCLGPVGANAEAGYDRLTCPVVKGTLGAGVACVTTSLGDDCSPGLACVAGTCVAATIPVPAGEPCGYEWDQLPCAAGNYCSYDATAQTDICKRLPAAGDPCDPSFDYLCGPASLDLLCGPTGRCEQAPGEGQPCFDGFLCGPGLYCDGGQDFTCRAKAELGEGCGGDAVCPVDASCVSNLCQADPAAACGLIYTNL